MTNKAGTHTWCLSTYKWIPIKTDELNTTRKNKENTDSANTEKLSGRNLKPSIQHP